MERAGRRSSTYTSKVYNSTVRPSRSLTQRSLRGKWLNIEGATLKKQILKKWCSKWHCADLPRQRNSDSCRNRIRKCNNQCSYPTFSSRRPRIELFLRDCRRRSGTISNEGHACARVARPVRHHLSNTKFTAVRYDQVGEAVARLLVETADLISHPRVVHFATEAVSTIVVTSLCCTFPYGCSRSDWSF